MDSSRLKFFLRFILCLYLLVLSYVLFYQVGSTDRETYFVNPDDHLIPFHSTFDMVKRALAYRHTSHSADYQFILVSNVFGNLVLLLPWGFLAPLAFKKLNKFSRIAFTGFLISLLAEVVQFTFSLGVFDIDDLLFNTVGAVSGFYLLQAVKYLFWKLNAAPVNSLQNKEYNQHKA